MNSSAVQSGLLNMFRNFPVASRSEEERGLRVDIVLWGSGASVPRWACLTLVFFWHCWGKTKGFFLLGIFCSFKTVVPYLFLSLERRLGFQMLLQQGKLSSGLNLNSFVSLSVVWLHWDSLPGWTGEIHQRAGWPCDQPAEDGGTKIWHGRVPLWQAHPRGQWQWELKSCREPPCGFQWDSYFTVQPCMHLQLSR